MPLSIFGFQALWSPMMIGTLLFLTGLYSIITNFWYKDFRDSWKMTGKEGAYFLSAVLLYYFIKGSPIDLLSHIMFSVHMMQMAVLLLLIPILLIKGIPSWLWRTVVELPGVRAVFRFATKPLRALIVFVGLFSVYHIPLIFDTVKLDEGYHSMVTLLLFVTAFFMWWCMFNPVEPERRLQGLVRIGYLVASAILITPACALIMFASDPMYATYTAGDSWRKAMELCVPLATLDGLALSGPELFTNMSALNDQQLGGVMMKIIQEIIYAFLLYFFFVDWYRKDRRQSDENTMEVLRTHQVFEPNK